MTQTVFENAIEADGLVKRYGEVQALDGVDLHVEAGTVFGLLGPNGAGKSTTVRILTTLVAPGFRSRPRRGASTSSTQPVAVRRAIGVVGQKHGSDPEATGRENLVLQGELYGIAAAKARAAEMLERFGLADAADRQVKTYSGGMERRLDVALGLIHRPQVLFLDEPTTGLDPEARAELWAEIERLAREERMTILLTTHYLEEADRLASQLAIVDRGRIVARGTPDELKAELQGDTVQVELTERRRRGRADRARTARAERGAARGPDAARPHRQRRGGDPRRARRARGERRARGVGDARAPLAGRRLPPTRRKGLRRMNLAIRQTYQVSLRYLRALLRQPAFVVITIVQPLIWLLLFGALFKAVTQIPGFGGGSYLDYLTPGVVVMLAVSTAGWTGMGFIEDMNRGVMDRMLVTPAWRGALNLGSVAQCVLSVVIQTLLIIVLALIMGAHIDNPLALILRRGDAGRRVRVAVERPRRAHRPARDADRRRQPAPAPIDVPVRRADATEPRARVDPERREGQSGGLGRGLRPRSGPAAPGGARGARRAVRLVRDARVRRLPKEPLMYRC